MRPSARISFLAFAALTAACASPARSPVLGASTLRALHYETRVASSKPWILDVSLTLEGGAPALTHLPDAQITSLSVTDARGARVPTRLGSAYRIDCKHTCRVHYRIDLSRTAEHSGDDLHIAARSGSDLLTCASTWLLPPHPLPPGLPVTLRVEPAENTRFLAGFHQSADKTLYQFRSHELAHLGYAAFGTFPETHIDLDDRRIDLAILGKNTANRNHLLTRWVDTTAHSLETVFERFPTSRVALFLYPIPRARRVLFGRVRPAGGPSILVTLGTEIDDKTLREDNILAHEFAHLGMPSLGRGGRFLEEGFASYYAPILRARAGLAPADELWAELLKNLPRGLPARGDADLAFSRTPRRIYWGGATFALTLDVLIRARSGYHRSLDHGLRALLADGRDVSHVMPVADFLRTIDHATGTSAATELYELARGASCIEGARIGPFPSCLPERGADLRALFHSLGVDAPQGRVTLRSDAPLSLLRLDIDQAAPRRRSLLERYAASAETDKGVP